MRKSQENERALDRVILLFLFALFLLVSPFMHWWAADDSPWYAPFLIWAFIIFITYRLQRRQGRHDL